MGYSFQPAFPEGGLFARAFAQITPEPCRLFWGENAFSNEEHRAGRLCMKRQTVWLPVSSCVQLRSPGPSGWAHAFLFLPPSRRLDELNLSWCFDFTEKHVQAAVAHLPDTLTQLNLSGYRKNLQKTG